MVPTSMELLCPWRQWGGGIDNKQVNTHENVSLARAEGGTQHRQERVIKEALSEEMTLEGREL